MQGRARRIWLVAGVLALALMGLSLGSSPAHAQISGSSQNGQSGAGPINATVAPTPFGRAMGPGFGGVSVEFGALHAYTGSRPKAVNPVLVSLLRGLTPGQSPLLRVGGDSTDATWWPVRGVKHGVGLRHPLTIDWLQSTQALAQALRAHLILGINLAARRPKLAATEGRMLLSGIGRRYVSAFEIGNEADVYGSFPWYTRQDGERVFARGTGYDFATFTREFSHWRAVLPAIPLAGPAFAKLSWLSGLDQFLSAEPSLRVVTVHRYPLHACDTDPSSPTYPSIANLLQDDASSAVAQSLAQYAATAHAHHMPFRVDEMNSVSCRGSRGVSDTFASALWVLDLMFNLQSVGVDGVNLHTLPGSAYELFTFSHPHGSWRAFVHPEYYGMLMFAQAFPPGARQLSVAAPRGPVKIWATFARDRRTRVVLINKDPTRGYQLNIHTTGATGGRPATLEWLQAPSVTATAGVLIGGRSFGSRTYTGRLQRPQANPIGPTAGAYQVNMPPASAALLTQ